MSVTVLVLATLLLSAAPAELENQNDCWRDSGTSGPKESGRYEYRLVNACDRTIHVWDAVVLWRGDGAGQQWSCGNRAAPRDEAPRAGCRPLIVKPGETVSYSARSAKRYWFFTCDPDDATCNRRAKKWADQIHGLSQAFDPGEVARHVGQAND